MSADEILIAQPSMPKTALRFTPPPRSCDCHVHVFGPYARFPLAAKRTYTPPEAPLAQLQQLLDALGLERVVIVQPSVYGTDNAATLDAAKRLGANGRAVVVIDESATPQQLADMHASGARGIRINLLTTQEPSLQETGALLRRMAEKIAPLGWRIQLFVRLGLIAQLRRTLAALPVRVVIDHFGWAHIGAADAADLAQLCALLDTGNAYVKLSAAYRISPDGFADPAVAALARRLIATNSERMVWGTDWPHPAAFVAGGAPPGLHDIDDGAALNALAAWTGDDATLKRILVDNPAQLYGFT